jgi:hypothetical protein
MIEKCFECGEVATERHHVIPRSKGGTKTVALCSKCHGLVHGIKRLNISELTKAALDARREKVGEWRTGHNFTDEQREKAAAKVTAKAATNKNTMLAKGYAKRLQTDGLTLEAIAARLNSEGHKAPNGGTFSKVQVKRLLEK